MSLQLILGRSGTGKSEHIYKEIKEKIDNKEKIYIITPEQFSFTAEKKLLEVIGREAVINAEVVNFNRIASRVFTEVGGLTKAHLSKCGRVMLIYDILNRNKKNLKFLSAGEKNISVVLNAITEFKKHGIKEDDGITIPHDLSSEVQLIQKLNDLNLLYKAFEESIKNKYIDENDILSLLASELPNSKMFDNTLVYIDEFLGFTAPEYEVIKQILLKSDKVTVALTADAKENENLDLLNSKDIFYEPKKTASKLIKAARCVGVRVDKTIFMKESYRFKNEELKFIEKSIDKLTISTNYEQDVKNFKIFLSKNPYSEVEYLAKTILELVRDEGYEYNDISVITKNIDTYSSLIKAIFPKFNIPVFIDENADMNDNLIAKYIVSLLEIIDKNFDHDAIFNYLKNPFSGYDFNDVFLLEKYVITWGIKNKKWQSVWTFEDVNLKKLEEIRKEFVKKMLNLKFKINENRTYKGITKAIYMFLIEGRLEEKLNTEIEQLEKSGLIEEANEYRTSIKIILAVFDEMVNVFDMQNISTNSETNDRISFNKYKELLKLGFENVSTGKIPATLDNVIVGDINRSKSHKVKVLFLIGLNDGVFPASAKDEGFLNDDDRTVLKSIGYELASDTLEQLYQEQFNVYKAFSIAEEKLILTYVSSDKEGKSLRPSSLINKMKKFFPKLKLESDVIKRESEITLENSTFEELLLNLRKFQDGEKIDEIWFEVYNWYNSSSKWQEKLQDALLGLDYSNIAKKLDKTNVSELYTNTLKTSVSKIEQYRNCPFSYYLKYGLKLKEEEELKLKPVKTGSFMHEVIDEFFKEYEDVYLREVSEEDIEKTIYEIIDEKLGLPVNYIFTSTPKFINLTNRLKKVIVGSIKYIVYQLKNSSFKILGNEMEFKEGKDYPPIIMDLENGQQIEITGKIDRVDIAIADEKKYIRIIDYKSSVKNIDLNKVVNGLQIQLLTYLDSITELENVEPAGILYFNLIEPMVKESKNLSDEEIEQKIKEQFRMKGLILADVKVVRMMDNRLKTGKSDIIAAEISSKEEKVSEKGGNPITKEDFANLQKQVRKTIKEISTEILEGNIDIKPFKNGKKIACEYCEYKSICRFNININGNEYLKIKKKKKQEILSDIAESSI